jgi:hypothetical protein
MEIFTELDAAYFGEIHLFDDGFYVLLVDVLDFVLLLFLLLAICWKHFNAAC